MQQKEHVWQEERSFSLRRRRSRQEVGRLAEGSGSLELNGCLAGLLWSNTCAQKKWLEVSPCVFLTANLLSHARLWQTERPDQGVNTGAATLAAFRTSTCAEDQDSALSEKKIFIIISWICSSECCEFKAGSSVLFNVNCCCCWCCCCCCCCCSQEFSGCAVQYRNRRRGRSRQCDVSEKLRTFCVLVQEQISTILEGSSVFIQPPQCCTQSVNCASSLPVCSQSSIHCESCCVQFSVSSSVLLLFTELLLKLALFF